MKAMILAAGLGTRLRPMTDDRPKALVELGGRTLLEITLERLKAQGVREAIVNVHHFADMVVDYLTARNRFGIRIEISREPELLDTGGGLKQAAPFFLEDPRRLDEPFILHNVDVLSTVDLDRMLRFHRDNRALATLAVAERPTSRYLLFDEHLELCGRQAAAGDPELVRPPGNFTKLGFSGIHVISPRLLPMLSEEGSFSIIPAYLRLAGRGERILGFRADEYYWRDLGRLEDLGRAEADIATGLI